jgi:type IV pilus assembly protein PilB
MSPTTVLKAPTTPIDARTMSQQASDQEPIHLELNPDEAAATLAAAAELDALNPEPEAVESDAMIRGLTPPRERGHSAGSTADIIAALGFAGEAEVREAIEAGIRVGRTPESILLNEGTITGDQLSRALSERYGLDHIDLTSYHVDLTAASLFPVGLARRYRAVPVGYLNAHMLLVAVADPANILVAEDIRMATGLDCRIAVAAVEDIESLLSRLGTLQDATAEAVLEDADQITAGGTDTSLEAVAEMQASAGDAPVIKLVYSILTQAVSEGASDVHLEPEEGELRIRFRTDGVLKEAAHVPRRMIGAVISRLKIMSELDIAEKRIPQDGRIGVSVEDRRIDLRITTLPTQRGEGATIRILDEENSRRTLDDLGMDGSARANFEESFRKPHGAVLVTGPTGSGKSTTLYAALAALNSIERKIITIEDPVEYRIGGINQINVNRKAGLDFATGLRSILRADPDIVMVGEIRDAETARIAIEAALTGHLMLSTLHTNNAPGAIVRLNEMGIEPFLTASAVDCVVAQRLARKLCTQCKRPTEIPPAALANVGIRANINMAAFEPVGCARCGHTGYRGRVGIYSVMQLTERLKGLAVGNAPEPEVAAVARSEGMLTLREDGFKKVRSGQTSLQEVLRVTA